MPIKPRHPFVFGGGGDDSSGGGKNGSSSEQRQPKEDEDNLFSITYGKVVDVLCEGPIEGFPEDGEDALKYVYLNGTKVRNDNGTYNFSQIINKLRFGNVEEEETEAFSPDDYLYKTISIGKKIYKDVPVSQAVTNYRAEKVKIAIKVPTLRKIDSETGDIKKHKVSVNVYVNGQKKKTITIKGKTTGGYVKEFALDIGKSENSDPSVPHQPRSISLKRKDSESFTTYESDDVYWEYMVEMIPAKLYYPYCALSSLEFDSRQFGQVPSRAFELKLMKVKVPSNYDPETREYDGDWDGEFSDAKWTDNPAWIVYDLLTNPVYGAGEYFSEDMIDKWSLYEIAKYNDELLPTGLKDGDGDDIMEPRFSCNCYLSGRKDAFSALSEIVSSFRGLMVWSGGRLTFVQDRPKEPILQFNNSNVSPDGFSYVEMDKTERYTAALVSYQDKRDEYKRKSAYVEDQEAIRTLGLRQIETEDFGCTSESQAHRKARWLVYSTLFEKETVAFRTGTEAMYLQPGDIIQISDSSRTSTRKGGRISSIDAARKIITLDDSVYIDPSVPAYIYLCIPKNNAPYDNVASSLDYEATFRQLEVEKRLIKVSISEPSYVSSIEVEEAFSDSAVENSVWIFETEARDTSKDGEGADEFNQFMFDYLNLIGDRFSTVDPYGIRTKKYRVLSINESTEKDQYDISALEYSDAKFDFIERNIITTQTPSTPTGSYLSPPYAIVVQKFAESDGIEMLFSWQHSPDRYTYPNLYYEITYIVDGVTHISETSNNFFTLSEIPYTASGNITFNVAAKVREYNLTSSTISKVTPITPQAVSTGMIENLALKYPDADDTSLFYTKNADVIWSLKDEYADQEEYVSAFEIKIYNGNNVLLRADTVAREDLSTSTSSADFQYTYTFENNTGDSLAKGLGSTQRTLKFQVRGILRTGGYTNTLSLTAHNDPPDALVKDTDFVVLPAYNGAMLNIFQANLPVDYAGCFFYYSTGAFSSSNINSGTSLPTSASISYKVIPSPTYNDTIQIDGSRSYYMAVSAYDTYGSGSLNMSDVFTMSSYGASTGTPPSQVNGFYLDSAVDYAPDLSATIKVFGSWNLNPESDISYYEIGFRESGAGGEYETYLASPKQTSFYIQGQRFTTYQSRIRAFNLLGLAGPFITGAGHTTPNVALTPSGGFGSGMSLPVGGMFLHPNTSFPSGEDLYFDIASGQWLETGVYPELWAKYKDIAPVAGTQFRIPSGKFNNNFYFAIRVA